MNLKLYLVCFAIAALGQLLANLLKANSLKQKAKAANINFTIGSFFANDILSILASLVFIVICLFLIDTVFKVKPAIVDYIKPIFLFIGYAGGDLASRIFSVANQRLNAAIDIKTGEGQMTDAPKMKDIK